MTNKVTWAYYPDNPISVSAFNGWLAGATAAGYTVREPDETKSVRIVTLSQPEIAPPAPLGPSEQGGDISHHNNGGRVLDFTKYRAGVGRYVWIKRAQGVNFTDPLGEQNFMAALGKIDYIGNYLFFEWRQNGARQAEWFSSRLGEPMGNLPELVDVELENWDRPENVVKATAEANLRSCLARCEELFLRKPYIYTSRHYWTSMFNTASVADIARNYTFVVADWTAPLDLPVGLAWAHFHQKSATHQVAGLSGDYDLIEYLGDPPPFPSVPLYQARALTPLNLRDKDGNLITGATVPAGATVQVWQEKALIGPNTLGQVFEDRAVLASDGRNVWRANLQRLT